MHRRAIGSARVARHMNYTRTFPTPTTTKVEIPCVSIEAFDCTGIKLKPWSIMNLLESVSHVAYWSELGSRAPATGTIQDFSKILDNHLMYILAFKLRVHKQFHGLDGPTFPMYGILELKHVGKSSARQTVDLFDRDNEFPYVTLDVDSVIVSSTSKQPAPYPDWFREQFSSHCTGKKSERAGTIINNIGRNKAVRNSWSLYPGDIDSYNHANWAAMVRFCAESFSLNVHQCKYANLSTRHVAGGVKTITAMYQNEAKVGDSLTVESWETEQDNTADFDVLNNGSSCFQARVEFYSEDDSS